MLRWARLAPGCAHHPSCCRHPIYLSISEETSHAVPMPSELATASCDGIIPWAQRCVTGCSENSQTAKCRRLCCQMLCLVVGMTEGRYVGGRRFGFAPRSGAQAKFRLEACVFVFSCFRVFGSMNPPCFRVFVFSAAWRPLCFRVFVFWRLRSKHMVGGKAAGR